jgi:hypothetical protein
MVRLLTALAVQDVDTLDDMSRWVMNKSIFGVQCERREEKDMVGHRLTMPMLSQIISTLRVALWNCNKSWLIIEIAVIPCNSLCLWRHGE